MKAARLVVLGVALLAGGIAAYLAAGGDEEKKEAPRPALVTQLETVDVLIAKADIAMGTAVGAQKNGQRVVVGKTATLELAPRQAETLALRSLLDANQATTEIDGKNNRKTDINTVRYGVSSQ
jgi:Flp pilus assembly protein CpaB